MSALAQHRALAGLPTSGSDRALDAGAVEEERQRLIALRVHLHPQDGSGVAGAAQIVSSTAVEAAIPDLAEARARDIPVVHRADVLAELLGDGPSVAVAGTSGKSTVTAMTFTILEAAGRDPGLVTGGDLVSLRSRGLRGNAWRGAGPMVAEADESDGSLVKHRPAVGVVLNLHRDHMDPARVLEQFRTFAANTRDRVVVAEDEALASLHRGSLTFGFGAECDIRGTELTLNGHGSSLRVDGVPVQVPLPGAHNASNALAAIAATAALDVDIATAARALGTYEGVARRFQVLGEVNGITVVEDCPHNPTKSAAPLRAARARAGSHGRVLALFQPHGFAPARFMREELALVLPAELRPEDRLWIADIHYVGGTAAQDISSADLATGLRDRGAPAFHLSDHEQWLHESAAAARPGDVLLVMGARDPALPRLARQTLEALAP